MAISKNQIQEKFSSNEIFFEFYLIMDYLVFRYSDPKESEKAYSDLIDVLSKEPLAINYFNRQWRPYLHLWMAQYRGDGDSTNNISESHFKQLKHSFFLGKKHMCVDDFFLNIFTSVIPTFLIKVHAANNDKRKQTVNLLQKAQEDSRYETEIIRDEVLRQLKFVCEVVEERGIEPELISR